MKNKIIKIVLISFVFFLSTPITLFAASSNVEDNTIDVILTKEGDAKVTQQMNVEISDATEFFIGFLHSDTIELKDVTVAQDGAQLKRNDAWPKKGTIEDKAGQYTVLDAGDKDEIVWGPGDEDKHHYTISYTLTNIVRSYDDVDGFHTRFLNDNIAPKRAEVTISFEDTNIRFSPENTKIWAFGYAGTITFDEGKIVAKTTAIMDENNYINIMASFEKGMFNPRVQKLESFEKVKDEAFAGSDYLNDDSDDVGDGGRSSYTSIVMKPGAIIGFGILAVSVVGTLVGSVFYIFYANSNSKYYVNTYGMSIDKYVKEKSKGNYYRDIPFNGDALESLYALQEAGVKIEDTDILATLLLRWVDDQNIVIAEVPVRNFFGKEKNEVAIKFVDAPIGESESAYEMYTLLFNASDSKHILLAKDVKKVTMKKGKEITKWKENLLKEGEKRLLADGYIKDRRAKDKQKFGNEKYVLTETGVQEVIHLLELKNYLNDYSLIHEREAIEVNLWKEYLLYASLLGNAIAVAKQFGELLPKYFENETYGNHIAYMRMTQNIHILGASYNSGYQSYAASSGAGGASSMGGGGGFSGGGGGGGAR